VSGLSPPKNTFVMRWLKFHERPAHHTTRRLLPRTIAEVRKDLTDLRPNTAVAKLITLDIHLTGIAADTGSPREVVEPQVLMITPSLRTSLAYAAFPTADPALIIAEQLEFRLSDLVHSVVGGQRGLLAATNSRPTS
jgi:hypothetical protein